MIAQLPLAYLVENTGLECRQLADVHPRLNERMNSFGQARKILFFGVGDLLTAV